MNRFNLEPKPMPIAVGVRFYKRAGNDITGYSSNVENGENEAAALVRLGAGKRGMRGNTSSGGKLQSKKIMFAEKEDADKVEEQLQELGFTRS